MYDDDGCSGIARFCCAVDGCTRTGQLRQCVAEVDDVGPGSGDVERDRGCSGHGIGPVDRLAQRAVRRIADAVIVVVHRVDFDDSPSSVAGNRWLQDEREGQ